VINKKLVFRLHQTGSEILRILRSTYSDCNGAAMTKSTIGPIAESMLNKQGLAYDARGF
jgi:hypothetical protein